MAQFDVFRNDRGATYPLLVDVQADVFAQLETRTVVPLARRDRYDTAPISRATPTATIGGVDYVIVVPMLSAITRASLGKRVGSLASMRAELIAALDLLFTGS
ncbi:MAG: CcdB family protein [Acidobacteriota bacterium]